MTLNLQAKDSYHVFDSSGMLIVPSDELSWRDSIGRTVLAWIAYGKPKELFDAIEHCYNNPNLYRHPEHRELSSRDHWSYFLIQGYLEYGISRIYTGNLRMRGMNLWMKSLTQIGSRLAEFLYYLIYIPGALIGNIWLKFCRQVGRIGPERDNNWWIGYEDETDIHTRGLNLQHSRTKRQRLWGRIISISIPAYALHNKAWQIYVMPGSKRKERLKRILLKRVGKSNIMLRLLFGDTTVTQQEVDAYPHLTGYRPGAYLNTTRRTIREMTPEESAYNSYEHDLVLWLWPEGFPCKNCANGNPKHEDYCEFAWDEYNYGTTIWDCLGAK